MIAAHTLAELYAILTRLPVSPRIPLALALELIQRNVLDTCEVVALASAPTLECTQFKPEEGNS